MAISYLLVVQLIIFAWAAHKVWTAIDNVFLHPLARFPGPKFAAASSWYQTWQLVFLSKSWYHVLVDLHREYGEIVRVGPNELDFCRPSSYNEIYNTANRWDKGEKMYRSFAQDSASFGLLTYAEAKERKDVLQPMFSRRAIIDLQSVVQDKIDRLCDTLNANNAAGKSSDMLFALRCFTLDTIMTYCFAKDTNAIEAPNYRAPIIVAMNESLPSFIVFREFPLIRKLAFGMPPWLMRLLTPAMSGIADLRELLTAQVVEVTEHPETLKEAPHPIIYHRLLHPESTKSTGVPSAKSLYEEAQTLVFAGSDTVGNALMVGSFSVLRNPTVHAKLKGELKAAWPELHTVPKFQDLEKLPYLTAVIRETLRLTPNVPSAAPRVVPRSGATISGEVIPAGTVVGMSALFVQYDAGVFDDPNDFVPERWMQADSSKLEPWVVSFSKGPRMCLGQNLAMCELYLAFAALFRRFDLELDGRPEKDLEWTDCFVPHFSDDHVRAFCRPMKE